MPTRSAHAVDLIDLDAVAPDHVFVSPPNAVLRIKGGVLQVGTPAPPCEFRKPIDVFLASPAKDQRSAT